MTLFGSVKLQLRCHFEYLIHDFSFPKERMFALEIELIESSNNGRERNKTRLEDLFERSRQKYEDWKNQPLVGYSGH